jgi:predicted transcriptional regulator
MAKELNVVLHDISSDGPETPPDLAASILRGANTQINDVIAIIGTFDSLEHRDAADRLQAIEAAIVIADMIHETVLRKVYEANVSAGLRQLVDQRLARQSG